MSIGTISGKIAMAAGGVFLLFAAIYAHTYFYAQAERPAVSAEPSLFNREDAGAEYEIEHRTGQAQLLNNYFSTLEEDSDPSARRRAAFRIRYLASRESEDRLLEFTADEDKEVAKNCARALIRIWRSTDSPRAAQFVDMAMEAWRRGKFREAKILLENSLKLDPSISDMHRMLAATLLELGYVRRAKRAARKAADLNPHHFAAHDTLARCYASIGDKQQALNHINRALDIFPHYDKAQELKREIEESLEPD